MSCNFWTFDGISGRCYNHQANVMPAVLADVCQLIFICSRCYCHSFCGRCCCHYYDLYWQMLLPYSLLADVVAIVHFATRREDQNLIRTITEALYIRVNNPSLNKNIGKYHLPHIWDEVLCNSPELRLK